MTRQACAVTASSPDSTKTASFTGVDRPAPPGPLGTATAKIDDGRRREAEERAERGRLRAVVRLLDEAGAACEMEHLDGHKQATVELVHQARTAIAVATAVLADAGQQITTDLARLDHPCGGACGLRITEVMDVVWEVLDVVLDLLLPVRRRLHDAVGAETPVPPPTAMPLDVVPPIAPQGCAYCGRRCDRRDAAGVRFCSHAHLLRARRMRLARTTPVAGIALITSATGA
jgi:hypothetical protein